MKRSPDRSRVPVPAARVAAADGVVCYRRFLHRTIQVIILAGIASLGFWGGLAGRRAGLTGWRFVLCVACGLGLGAMTLMLQAILQSATEPFIP
jgi:hypothetical protein